MDRPTRTTRPSSVGRALPATRGAFTLVELLTVILILGLLMAILAPSLTKVRQLTMIKMTQTTINALDGACKAYASDFGGQDQWQNFPPSRDSAYTGGDGGSAPWRGSQLLALFLQGYAPDGGADGTPATTGHLDVDDGKEGPGFRIESRGKVYGPYGEADKLPFTGKFWDPSIPGDRVCPRFFVDAFDRPILYYRFTGTAYLPSDNGIEGYAYAGVAFEYPTPGPTRLGTTCYGLINTSLPYTGPGYAKNFGVGGSQYRRTDFLLISRGPNGRWWGGSVTNPDDPPDDVTNMFPNQ